MRKVADVLAVLFLAMAVSAVPMAQQPASTPSVLITNANIFDGKSDALRTGMSVLVEGNKITRIAASIPAPPGATVINAAGRTMSPGFVAVHEHLMLQMSYGEGFTSDTRYYAYVATQTADTYLMNGFTAVRDAGGNTFSLKKAIDKGIVAGPRIYPSGPMISQTSGHADHRTDAQKSKLLGGQDDLFVQYGDQALADGVPDVLKAVRESLRRGASQIKIAVGGGTSSYADPLDVVQFTPEEIRAATQAAADWGTYVLAHVYNSNGIRRAIDNGVKSIEHGQLIDAATLQYMKDKDIWLSPQVSVFQDIPNGYTADQANKHRQAQAGIGKMFDECKRVGFTKIGFGTDMFTSPERLKGINEEFVFRTKWFSPAEVLRQATSSSAELLALSGPRDPYPGKKGVIEEGALADILLINGDPLKDISILTRPEENLALIMKDGKIFKNTVR